MTQKASTEMLDPHQYPTDHVNHLSPKCEVALAAFKKLCSQAGCYTYPSQDAEPSHDDETMLRFLRARKYVAKDAFEQFQSNESWRKEQNIDQWYQEIDVDRYEETRLMYTQWTGRRDKRGIPLYVFDIGSLDPKAVSIASATKLQRLFATYEHLTQFVMPLCSLDETRMYPKTPISQTCNIVDVTGMSVRQLWNLKSHLQDASALANARYPETLGRTFIVGAPYWFPTVWNSLKLLLDPITVSKVVILAESEVKPTLEEYIDIRNIPRRYGGSLDWQFGQLPNIDPRLLEILEMSDEAVTIPRGPIKWEPSQDGAFVEAHARGSLGGKSRNVLVARVSKEVFSKSLLVVA